MPGQRKANEKPQPKVSFRAAKVLEVASQVCQLLEEQPADERVRVLRIVCQALGYDPKAL